MPIDFPSPTWNEALNGFVLHLKAVRAPKTVYFYEVQLRGLVRWATANDISLDKLGKRHLDAYLAQRPDEGKAQMTLHHDALAAKVFLKWDARKDFVERRLLATTRSATPPRPPGRCPPTRTWRRCLPASPCPGILPIIPMSAARRRASAPYLLMAQTIAGHKDTRKTLIYTRFDPEFERL